MEKPPVKDLLLSVVRSDFPEKSDTCFTSLTRSEWEELLAIALSTKIFPLLFQCVKAFVPTNLLPQFEELYTSHQQRVRDQLEALQKISFACSQESLRFVLIKGLALSYLVYGDFLTRQSGDIDILVDPNDLVGCDYVMRHCGFYQPDWTAGQTLQSRKAHYALQFLSKESIPYPSKRKAHDDQLAPYYACDKHLKVEVHDGLAHIPSDFMRNMLWTTSTIDADCEIRVLDAERSFLYLLLTTYENSEGFYSCVDGELNLRDYVDIHRFLSNQSKRMNWEETARLVEQLGLKEAISVVHSNYQDIYGCREKALEYLAKGVFAVSSYKLNYMDRVLDKKHSGQLAMQQKRDEVKRRVIEKEGCRLTQEGFSTWFEYDNPYGLAISYGLSLCADSIGLSWKIPERMVKDLALFGFQIAFLPGFETDCFEYIVSMLSNQKGAPTASLTTKNRLNQRFLFANKETHFQCSKESMSGFLTIRTSISFIDFGFDKDVLSAGIGIIPTVYKKISSNAYHSICATEEEFTSIQHVIYVT